MTTGMYPESSGGVKSRYVNGVLTFYNAAGAVIYTIDPVNRKVSYPSGATLESLGSFTGSAGVAGLLAAGLGVSTSYIKTDTGTKTLIAAHATKDRAVLVQVHIDVAFADGDTSQLILKLGETSTIEKCAAAAVFTNALVGTNFIFGFQNLATKAILATLTAAVGTGTGAATITVLAIPTS